MNELTETDVIRIMKEEWNAKLDRLVEGVSILLNSDINGDGATETLITPELKIAHKESGIRYTVSSVSPRDIVLRTPEGEEFLIDKKALEAEYEIA